MAGGVAELMRHWPGILATGLVLFLTLGTLGAVVWRAESWGSLGQSDWAAIKFTILQALVSAFVSTALAIPVARALARRSFRGKSVLVTLLGAPFILPVIVAVLGLLAVFGRNGLISSVLVWFDLPPVQIYGFRGVVLAHVFFNLPLATRLILQSWMSIPAERFRLAASLGFTSKDMFHQIEIPVLKQVLPGAFAVIFVVCTTSFAVALALGGGPNATTVELAIYQAFRFDFDLGKAAQLAVVQFLICAIAASLMLKVQVTGQMGRGLDRTTQRWDAAPAYLRIIDGFWIVLAGTFLVLPLAMVVGLGIPGLGALDMSIALAMKRSLFVAVGSAGIAVFLALSMAFLIQGLGHRKRAGVVEIAGYLAIAASPMVVGVGLFIIIFPVTDPVALALPITALINALMSLPFALRGLVPEVRKVTSDYARLADSLGLRGIQRLRVAYFPRLRRPIGFAAGLSAALSMGDLGVVTLFADPGQATLPLQLYRLMAAYRMEEAAAVALWLLVVSMLLFWVFDRGGRLNASA